MRGVKLERDVSARQLGGDCVPAASPKALMQAAPAVSPLSRVILMSCKRMFVQGWASLHDSSTAVDVADVPVMFANFTRSTATASDCVHRHSNFEKPRPSSSPYRNTKTLKSLLALCILGTVRVNETRCNPFAYNL